MSNAALRATAHIHEEDAPDLAEDVATLRRVVGSLAAEASDLGMHLVDIAGSIQDTAAQSREHAALFARLTQSATAIAGANGDIARALGETDKLAASARAVLGEQAVQLAKLVLLFFGELAERAPVAFEAFLLGRRHALDLLLHRGDVRRCVGGRIGRNVAARADQA